MFGFVLGRGLRFFIFVVFVGVCVRAFVGFGFRRVVVVVGFGRVSYFVFFCARLFVWSVVVR